MRQWTKRREDWVGPLSALPGLADDIAELLVTHDHVCVSRLAACYWLKQAGLTELEFLLGWAEGRYDA